MDATELVPAGHDYCALCGKLLLAGVDGHYILTSDDLGQDQWWHLQCRNMMLDGEQLARSSGAVTSCACGCPPAAMQVIAVPRDHLLMYCCRSCKRIQLHGPDGVSSFTVREVFALLALRTALHRRAAEL
jgi:hypothetical protein